MQIDVLPTGDPVHRYEKCIVVPFTGRRRVLSTCPFHGGYREDLTAVFNNDINPGPGMECRMLAAEYEAVARLTGLPISHIRAGVKDGTIPCQWFGRSCLVNVPAYLRQLGVIETAPPGRTGKE